METPRLLFTFAALTLVFYTTYLATHSPYAERRHPHSQPTSQTNVLHTSQILSSSNPAPQCAHVPLCTNRASLIHAISTGKGCTFKWFSATEICMILERFGAVVFAGDGVTGGVYKGLELLLSSQASDGVGGSRSGFGAGECACADNMFGHACLEQSLQGISYEFGEKEEKDQKVLQPICSRTPTTHIPLTTHPSTPEQIDAFKSLTYKHPAPWQPSPLILSSSSPPSTPSVPSTLLTTALLHEWRSLVLEARRNIPLLYLGPSAASSRTGSELDRIKIFESSIGGVAKEKGFEVLSLYNLTLGLAAAGGLGSTGEKEWERKVLMVEAMVVVNWLSKLETS